MESARPAALRVLLVGLPVSEQASLATRLPSDGGDLKCDVCTGGPDEALAIAARESVDALLVGPCTALSEVPMQLVSALVEQARSPVFLLLGAEAWCMVDWDALPLSCVDAVLEWEACQGGHLRALLRYNIARALDLRRLRAAGVRAQTLTAAVARLAAVRSRAALCTVAVDATLALRATGCAMLLAEDDDLVLMHARGLAEDEQHILARCSVRAANHPVAEAARTQRPVARRDGDESYVALPLVIDDVVAAVLWVRLPSAVDEELTTLEAFAGHLTVALVRTRRAERLDQRAEHAERLVAIVSHDLRSPLQVITMGASLLRLNEAVAHDKRFLVERIHESATRAATLVDELLMLGRAKRAGGSVGLARASAFALLRSCAHDFVLRMPDVPISVSLQGDGDAAIDRDHVTQALHNLLANAAHYREAGSTVHLRGVGAVTHVYLEVQNRGPVIDDAQVAELFAPMKRGTGGGERGSLGLGLYIVRTLIEGDGGRVWVRSSGEAGTTFVLALPRRASVVERVAEHDLLAPQRTPAGAVPPAYQALRERLPDGPLRNLLGIWLELGGASHLPHPRLFERTRLLAYLPDMFWVDVLRDRDGRIQFRLTEVGGMLERRLDGYPAAELLAATTSETLRPSMRAAYERCTSTGRPTFDYLRCRSSGAASAWFTRLVLPCSRDGVQVTQLIGVALFQRLDEASHARLSSAEAEQEERGGSS